MKFVTLLQVIAFFSVVVSTAMVVICLFSYIRSYELSSNSLFGGESEIESQNKSECATKDLKVNGTKLSPPKTNRNRKEGDDLEKFIVSTNLRGTAIGGIFACTQVIVSAFLSATDKKDSMCRVKAWIIFATFSSVVNLVTLIGSVRLHSKILVHQQDRYIYGDLDLGYIYKYYIMTGIYMVSHSLGIFVSLFFMRTPRDFNYKSLLI